MRVLQVREVCPWPRGERQPDVAMQESGHETIHFGSRSDVIADSGKPAAACTAVLNGAVHTAQAWAMRLGGVK